MFLIPPARVVCTMALVGIAWPLFSPAVRGQDHPPSRTEANPERMEKRLADIERQVSALLKELKAIRHELAARPRVTVVELKYCSAADAAQVLEEVYRGKRSLTVEVLRKMNCVAVRADAKMTREVSDLLRDLDKAAQGTGKGEGGIMIVGPPDPELMRKLLRQVDPSKAGRFGPFGPGPGSGGRGFGGGGFGGAGQKPADKK